jgi:hypothetical protein
MSDMMIEQRLHEIAEQKAALGAAYGYGYGGDEGGVLIGGRRRRRRAPVRRRRRGGDAYLSDEEGGVLIGGRSRRRPSAWNLKVKSYMRSHPRATLAQAAHALRGRGGRRAPVRRRRVVGYGVSVGGVRRRRAPVRRRRRVAGGARSTGSLASHLLYSKAELAKMRADRAAAARMDRKDEAKLYCSEENLKELRKRLSAAEYQATIGRCYDINHPDVDKSARNELRKRLRGNGW